jgi:hypothetical protein
MRFFSVGRVDKIRLSGQQTFRGGEPDKIFGRFDFALEVVVFRFDVCDRFGWRVRHAITNKGCVRLADIIDEVSDGLVERFARKSLGCEGEEQNKSEQEMWAKDHDDGSRYTALLQLMGRGGALRSPNTAAPCPCQISTPGVTRTLDLRIRNPLLYPAELRAQIVDN